MRTFFISTSTSKVPALCKNIEIITQIEYQNSLISLFSIKFVTTKGPIYLYMFIAAVIFIVNASYILDVNKPKNLSFK